MVFKEVRLETLSTYNKCFENQSSVDCSISIKVEKIFSPPKFQDWLWRQSSLLYLLGTGGSFPWHKATGSGS